MELPGIDREALLEVHASFPIAGTDRAVVNVQKVYYKSPVVVRYTGPTSLPADGTTTGELSASVSWKEVNPVDDGTIVNFSSTSPISPSVSETVNSVAGIR